MASNGFKNSFEKKKNNSLSYKYSSEIEELLSQLVSEVAGFFDQGVVAEAWVRKKNLVGRSEPIYQTSLALDVLDERRNIVGEYSSFQNALDSHDVLGTVTSGSRTVRKYFEMNRRWIGDKRKKSINPGQLDGPIFLRGGSASVFVHEVLGHFFQGDCNPGIFDLMGKQVSSLDLEVVDDPTLFKLAGFYEFDDRGVLAQPVKLISGGVVVGCLNDESSSLIAPPTPHSRRESEEFEMMTRPANTILQSVPLQEDLLPAQNELVIEKIRGGSLNHSNGTFNLLVECSWCSADDVHTSFEPFVWKGRVLSVLNRVSAIGSETTYLSSICADKSGRLGVGHGSPNLKISGVT